MENRTLSAHIYNKDNFVYFGIPKNGLISFTEFFKKNGWQYRHPKTSEFKSLFDRSNLKNLVLFGSISNPHSRHIKGLTEQYLRVAKHNDDAFHLSNRDELNNTFKATNPLVDFFLSSTLDEHTLPITKMIPSVVDPYKVDWIPIDYPGHPSEELMNLFFKENNLKLEMELNNRKHVSSKNAKYLQDLISRRMEGKKQYYDRFYTNSILEDDLKLYDYTMNKYKEKMKNISE